MNRLEKNLEVLDKLYHYLKENPTIRFGQALSNLNLATHRGVTEVETNIQGEQVVVPYFMDIFYEEPEETLDKMRDFSKSEKLIQNFDSDEQAIEAGLKTGDKYFVNPMTEPYFLSEGIIKRIL